MSERAEALLNAPPILDQAEVQQPRPGLMGAARHLAGRAATRAALSVALAAGGGAAVGAAEAVSDPHPDAAAASAHYVDDYPNYAAVDCSGQFGQYSWCVDENSNGSYQSGEDLSPRGYGYRNCTDGVAYWIGKFTGVTLPNTWGNGNNWDTETAYPVIAGTSENIEPGDVAQSDDGSFGHVGFVVKVTKNNLGQVVSFTTAELNKNGDGSYTYNTYTARNGSSKFDRGNGQDWDHFIDVNGTGKGLYNESLLHSPGDWNNDGTTDLAVFRPSDGGWHIRNVADFSYGQSGDVPVPGDYDGNGTIEAAVFRPGNNTWYIRGGSTIAYGQSGDIPVPADYNSDGITDIAVFRPSDGTWHIRNIDDFSYGQSGDVPLPGDYDGNGAIEAAVYRPSNQTWYIRGGSNITYGNSGDVPMPADYNGDHATDIAVFRPSDGGWHIRNIGDFTYGQNGDTPVVGDFDGNGTNEAAVYRPSNETWYVRGGSTTAYGSSGDIPVVPRF